MEWAEVLDDMEARVAETERMLRSGGPVPLPFSFDPSLGRLPPELEARARELLAETDRVMHEVAYAKAVVGDALRRRGEPASRPPAYVDTRA